MVEVKTVQAVKTIYVTRIESVNATGEMFIIPGKTIQFKNLTYQKNYINRFCEANGLEPCTDESKIVRVWIVSDDLGTENLADHGAHFYDPEKGHRQTINCGSLVGLMPAKFLENVKEGNTVSVTIPNCECVDYEEYREYRSVDADIARYSQHIDLHLELTAAQAKYRYSRFNTFENAFEYMVLPEYIPDPRHNEVDDLPAQIG